MRFEVKLNAENLNEINERLPLFYFIFTMKDFLRRLIL